MRTVYTVNTRNKFAALSLSDDEDDQQIITKQEPVKSTTGNKENPSSLIYPKNEVNPNAPASALDTTSKMSRGTRKGNTVHRGGRGGYTSSHGRVFDRRDASGKAHRVSKQNDSAGIEDEIIDKEKKYNNTNSSDVASNNQLDDNVADSEESQNKVDETKEKESQMISYEEYMKKMAPKRLEVPKTEIVKGNTTAKDFEKEGLQRYVRDDSSNTITNKNNKNKANKNNTKSDKGVFNYFELVEKYTSRNSYNRRGIDDRRNRGNQRPNSSLQVRREAPDVSDTRAFPVLGQ
ncbi:Hyaluronan/mRNA-binding protein [Cryptosporidium tyzzeri]|nr:Hyaluronan/mRNA-binding protein [Cryptosporidium tyzzeri]